MSEGMPQGRLFSCSVRPLALQALIEAVHKVKIADIDMCESRL
jgi:hypothetical protein